MNIHFAYHQTSHGNNRKIRNTRQHNLRMAPLPQYDNACSYKVFIIKKEKVSKEKDRRSKDDDV